MAAPKKYESYEKIKSDQEKKDELITAMIGKMTDYDDEEVTHNDDADGVDSDEWVGVVRALYLGSVK